MNDLGLDSLDHVEVIMAMEDEFGNSCSLVICVVFFIDSFIFTKDLIYFVFSTFQGLKSQMEMLRSSCDQLT